MATTRTPLNSHVRGGDEAPCRFPADLLPRWHVIEYITPVPSVTFATHSQQLLAAYTMAAVTTDTGLVNPQCYKCGGLSPTGRWFIFSLGRVCCACGQPKPSGTDRCRGNDPEQSGNPNQRDRRDDDVQVQQRTAEHPVDVLASSSTSSSTDRIDERTTALDSIIEQLSSLENLAAQMENIDGKFAPLAKRMMTWTLPELQERVSWKRRRYVITTLQIMENAADLVYRPPGLVNNVRYGSIRAGAWHPPTLFIPIRCRSDGEDDSEFS